jgi:hypothetical protein
MVHRADVQSGDVALFDLRQDSILSRIRAHSDVGTLCFARFR